jgi:choline monooxygenase
MNYCNMNRPDYSVETDITRAYTVSSDFYTNPETFEEIKESLFARSWQCIGLTTDLSEPESVQPFLLMPGFLDEPLVLTRDADHQLHCMSNVCTHRGNIIVEEGGTCRELRCRYHGRKFDLKGKFTFMPQFKEAQNFPSPDCDLPKTSLHSLGKLLFTSIKPLFSFEDWIRPVKERLSWLSFESFKHAPEYSQSYNVNAHWALYVDNYLEGFHIPFVHPGLNAILSFPDYSYELFDYANLQLGIAKPGESVHKIPEGHPDYGKEVAAYYFWLFPNIMMNFYPWGLSLNLITPISPTETQVRFETFIMYENLFNASDIDAVHETELEDEAIVEMVQRGVSSRLYDKGRYSPKMEVAVHHFHQLLGKFW